MYKLKRLLVGLDLTDMDSSLIAYSAMLADTLKADMVYFLHVAQSLDLPPVVKSNYPELIGPKDELIKHEIEGSIKSHFKSSCPYDVVVREGNAEEKILRWSKIKEIDLIVMGRKVELKGTGTLPGKLARIAPCSLMFITEHAKPQVKKVLVPVDFSETSKMALEQALKLTSSGDRKLIIENSYKIPTGYHTTGKSREEFAEIMKHHAYNASLDFLKSAGLTEKEVTISLQLDEDENPAAQAYELAQHENCDLIIIGSKGRAGLASLLLGSVADKMVQLNSKIPVLIVKNKDANMNFFQALLKV